MFGGGNHSGREKERRRKRGVRAKGRNREEKGERGERGRRREGVRQRQSYSVQVFMETVQ